MKKNFYLLCLIILLVSCIKVDNKIKLLEVTNEYIVTKSNNEIIIYNKDNLKEIRRINIIGYENYNVLSNCLIVKYKKYFEKISFNNSKIKYPILVNNKNNYDFSNGRLLFFDDEKNINYFDFLNENKQEIKLPNNIKDQVKYFCFYKGNQLFSHHKKNIMQLVENKPIVLINYDYEQELLYYIDEKEFHIAKQYDLFGMFSESIKYKNSYFTLLISPKGYKIIEADKGEIFFQNMSIDRKIFKIDKVINRYNLFAFRVIENNEIFVIYFTDIPVGNQNLFSRICISNKKNETIDINMFKFRIKEKIDDWLLENNMLFYTKNGKLYRKKLNF